MSLSIFQFDARVLCVCCVGHSAYWQTNFKNNFPKQIFLLGALPIAEQKQFITRYRHILSLDCYPLENYPHIDHIPIWNVRSTKQKSVRRTCNIGSRQQNCQRTEQMWTRRSNIAKNKRTTTLRQGHKMELRHLKLLARSKIVILLSLFTVHYQCQ